MMLLEFSMTPMDKGESVSPYVARSLELIEQSGLPYQLHSMGTVVEGEPHELFALLEKCFDAMKEDCHRVSCIAKIDYRAGTQGRLVAKVQSVEQKLGRELRKAP